ncbi:trypsin-like peptidase domain-containing protein [Synechococcus sp. M16CYN]|uniref:trypsin-like peptidase domain-containing protein n=1 Tax=Synechococcus sp. M16CYN TaxID=3103139 RepID=UPI00324F11E9
MNYLLRWVGFALIGTTLSSCSLIKSQLGLRHDSSQLTPPVVVNDKPQSAPLQPGENVIVRAVDRVGPAVVQIDVVKKVNNSLNSIFGIGPSTQRQQGQGSGFIIRSNGLILTNEHVVRGANQVAVTLPDGRSFKGKVLGGDPITDVAVVKVVADSLPVASLGNSDNLRPGEWAIAIGNPFGLNNTVTAGIISAVDRTNAVGEGQRVPYIQTDAAVNPGNSGGPLINAVGQVVGINTAIRTAPGGGLSFAVPVNLAKRIVQQIVSTGQASHPFIGIQLRNLTPRLAEEINAAGSGCKVPKFNGVMITDVVPNTPAAKVDIRRCDLILGVDGKSVRNSTEVQLAVDRGQVGRPMLLRLRRDGNEITVEVRPKELPRRN